MTTVTMLFSPRIYFWCPLVPTNMSLSIIFCYNILLQLLIHFDTYPEMMYTHILFIHLIKGIPLEGRHAMDISHIVYNLEGSIPWKGEVLARYTNTLGREKMIQRENRTHHFRYFYSYKYV